MLPELLMHGRDYADFLEGINSENKKDNHE
jgi:hypothetical protein